MTLSARDRVFSAAEMINFECTPTASMVQAAAGVSLSEAARYLAEWNDLPLPEALGEQLGTERSSTID